MNVGVEVKRGWHNKSHHMVFNTAVHIYNTFHRLDLIAFYWDGILGHQFDKKSSLFFNAIQSVSTGAFKTKPESSLVLKIHAKNPRNKKTRVYSWIALVKRKNEGRKPDKNLSLRRFEFKKLNCMKHLRRLLPTEGFFVTGRIPTLYKISSIPFSE